MFGQENYAIAQNNERSSNITPYWWFRGRVKKDSKCSI